VYPLIPVILMTAQGSEEIAAQALQHGAASYVPKRKLADDLVPTVLRVLLGALEDRAHSNLMHYLDAGMVTFVLPNNRSLIQALVAHVQEMLRSLPLEDETERLRVGIALEEALDNALYHGNLEIGATLGRPDREACEQLARERSSQAPYRDRRIHVSIRLSRDEAVFVIRDDGPGFDASKLPEGADLAEEESEAGRGINLMRTFMDEVRYNDRGNEVTLIKRRVREAPPEEPKPGDAGQA
jgi:anti-sigma regulatory factor (Ser/Thr protein kinase)